MKTFVYSDGAKTYQICGNCPNQAREKLARRFGFFPEFLTLVTTLKSEAES